MTCGKKIEGLIDRVGLAWLPVLSFLSAISLLTTSYLVALSYHQLEGTKLAFISDTGAQPPSSCWFSLLMNLTAFCFLAVVLTRYIEIKFHLTHKKDKIMKVNVTSCVFGVMGSLGMWVVAAFQETNASLLHQTGASIIFMTAVIFTCLQSYLTRQLIKEKVFNYKWMLILRIIVATVYVVAFFAAFGCSSEIGNSYPPYNETNKPYDNATIYYFATGTEWTATISLFLFVLSFAYEFSTVKLKFDVSTASTFVPNDK